MTSAAWTVRVAAAVVLGWFLAQTVLPPRGGPVPAVARTYDPDLAFLLWPWQWGQADPRLLLILPMVLLGALLAGSPRWLAAGVAVPVLVETWQLLLPGVGEVAAARDVAHAWIGLATGALVVIVARAAVQVARRVTERLRTASTTHTTPTASTTYTTPPASTANTTHTASTAHTTNTISTARGAVPGTSRVGRTAVAAGLSAAVLVGVSAAWPPADGEAVAAGPTVGTQGPLQGSAFHGAEMPDAAAQRWLQAGDLPGEGTAYEEMARVALWDLFLLTRDPLPPAGPAAQWDYFWPRDGAFVAVALLRTGHAADAVRILERHSRLYLDPLYGFDARYRLDGQRVTADPRGAQVDGCGWVLWAIHETAQVTDVPREVTGLRDRCADQVLRATDGGTHLSAPSPDYWERATFDRLLGANAPLLLGLRSAAADEAVGGSRQRSEALAGAADSFSGVLAQSYGPTFSRSTRGGGLDAAVAMLMPPFDPQPLPGVREALDGYQEGALRPAGGLAPGTDWRQDGVSWTPEVALVAYTAAADGQVEVATGWLDWLEAHRAPWGSLPEKVGPDGTPGGPAPLGWTSALVLLTLEELGL